MNEAITYRIGIDVAKGVFQVHGVKNEASEPVAMVRRLKRAQVEPLLAKLPRSLIGMEACGSAHHWARQGTAGADKVGKEHKGVMTDVRGDAPRPPLAPGAARERSEQAGLGRDPSTRPRTLGCGYTHAE